MGSPKVFPASVENATNVRSLLFSVVNHATATVAPRALTDGPLTGHPCIFQPSRCTGAGVLHLPAVSREMTMSRTSSGLRSRYTATRPSDVHAVDSGQQSHTRL